MRAFSADERAAIDAVVKGDDASNFFRKMSKFGLITIITGNLTIPLNWLFLLMIPGLHIPELFKHRQRLISKLKSYSGKA